MARYVDFFLRDVNAQWCVFLGRWLPRSRSSQKAARRHRAAQEHPRSTRTSPGQPRSSQRPDSRMLQTCGLVSAFSVVETYFLSQSAYAHLNAGDAAIRNHI